MKRVAIPIISDNIRGTVEIFCSIVNIKKTHKRKAAVAYQGKIDFNEFLETIKLKIHLYEELREKMEKECGFPVLVVPIKELVSMDFKIINCENGKEIIGKYNSQDTYICFGDLE
jgi:hypothetical protein